MDTVYELVLGSVDNNMHTYEYSVCIVFTYTYSKYHAY